MTAIVLPPLPPMTHYGGTATVVFPEWLRARDIEVARLVLEAAAQTCKQKAGRMRNMRDYAGGNAEFTGIGRNGATSDH